MHYTIERLMNGDAQVTQQFVAAKERWGQILADIDTISVADLAKRLANEQFWFEHNCGTRWPGQEVMAWTGFASLYTTAAGYDGNEERAEKLLSAFSASMVSGEVKSHAKEAAKAYFVGEQ